MMSDFAIPCGEMIYMYGMVVLSTIHRMAGSFPELDTYGEIAESYHLPGGEAGNSAIVLKKLGYQIRLDGPYLGTRTKEKVLSFYNGIGVDCSGMEYTPCFGGVEDLVIVADGSRTVFGKYGHYFSGGRLWSKPDEKTVASSKIVGLDPFFFDESNAVAEFCVKHGVPYVTIDCPPDSFMCRNAAAVVISHEYIQNKYAGEDLDALLEKFTSGASGLIIFTFGGRDIMYGRKGGISGHFKPYAVKVKSTLGAGDTFRAGIMHGVLKGLSDETTVAFGAAMAANVCTHFPVALTPPSLEEITSLISSRDRLVTAECSQ
jgi:sugar/nucleoside kinase (ribokinase family)